jgi:hypothetical protein
MMLDIIIAAVYRSFRREVAITAWRYKKTSVEILSVCDQSW